MSEIKKLEEAQLVLGGEESSRKRIAEEIEQYKAKIERLKS